MKKSKMFDRIFDSVILISKNPKLFLPDIVFFLITAGLLALFLYINGVFHFDFSQTNLNEQIVNQVRSMLGDSSSLIRLIVSFVVLLIVNLWIGLSLINLRYNMIKNVIINKQVGLFKSYLESKKFMFSLLFVKMLLFFLYAIPFVIIIPLFTGLINSSIVGVILLALLYAFLYVIFFFVYPVLYLAGSRNPFKVMKNTFKFCKRNLRYSLLAVVVVLFISIFVGVIASYISSNLTSLFSQVGVTWVVSLLLGILFVILKLIDITLTLWTELFSFISYKVRV